MLILDTDHLTIIQRATEPAYTLLRTRLRQDVSSEICTTVVNVEEQMRGWLTVLAQARDIHQEVAAYRRLHALFTFFGNIVVLASSRLGQHMIDGETHKNCQRSPAWRYSQWRCARSRTIWCVDGGTAMLASTGARAAGEAIEPAQCRIQVTNGRVLALLLWGERVGLALGEQHFETLLQAIARARYQCCLLDVNGNRPIRKVLHPGMGIWSSELIYRRDCVGHGASHLRPQR